MSDPRRVVSGVFPQPGAQYDRNNEAAFRADLQRQISQLADGVRELAGDGDTLTGGVGTIDSTVAALVTALAALTATVSSLVATITPTFASIYVEGGTTAQTGITTPVKLTCFSADGANGQFNGNATPDKANNEVSVEQDGLYLIIANVAFSGSAATGYHFSAYVDGVDSGLASGDEDHAGVNTVGSVALHGVLSLSNGEAVSIYAEADSSANITVESAGLTLVRLGPTLTGPVA